MIVEKRKKKLDTNEMLSLLTASQTFALGQCSHDECELAFIRDTDDGPLAVVKIRGIDRSGRLSAFAQIKVRS